MDFDENEALGWDSYWEAHWAGMLFVTGLNEARLTSGRVARIDRQAMLVASGAKLVEVKVAVPGNCNQDEQWPPVVGDWVALTQTNGVPTIAAILPRRNLVERASNNLAQTPQAVAANISLVGIVEPLDPGISAGRVERFTAMGRQAGVEVVLIATKADLVSPDLVSQSLQHFAPSVDAVFPTSSSDFESLDPLVDKIGKHGTVALLGRSGAGKSTLTNMLTGAGQATKAVRSGDGKGRHTTTARSLHQGNQVVVIDTPGVREIAAPRFASAIDRTFDDVIAYAEQCRFADCSHSGEPGCVVVQAIKNNELDAARVGRYLRLRAESDRRSQTDRRVLRAQERSSTKKDRAGKQGTMRLKGKG